MAIALGVLLAGAPLLVFDYLISRVVEQRAVDEINTVAKRAIALAEIRVGQAITVLDALTEKGVVSCSGAQLDAMREAVFGTPPLKEVAVVDAEGGTICSHFGTMPGRRIVLYSAPLRGAERYIIELVAVADNDSRVRLRRTAPNGGVAIAGLLPTELFVPQVAVHRGPFDMRARMFTHDGTLLGEAGNWTTTPSGAIATAWNSKKYGFKADVTAPRGAMIEEHSDLQMLSLLIKGVIACVLLAFAALVPRRHASNPVAELERALDAGEFIPYYQPIVDIRSGQLRGAEVLVRWKKPDGTIVLPGSFIPLAESSGLILPLTRALMRQVCSEAGVAVGLRPGLKISFNFAAQLFEDSVVKDVRNVFSGSPIDLSQVVLELTERDPIDNLAETRRVIAALQTLGVRIAIDDVGTGHSGLSYMLKLGVDIIKIDKMFVDAIGTDRNSTTIVETLIDLAHNMRMDVVAEGVETFEQVVHLRELGIRSAQGYVFAPPLPGSAFLQLIEAIDPLPAAVVEAKVAGAARRYMSARNKFSAA